MPCLAGAFAGQILIEAIVSKPLHGSLEGLKHRRGIKTGRKCHSSPRGLRRRSADGAKVLRNVEAEQGAEPR